MDTVTLVRSAHRQLLDVVETELEAELRGVLGRDDDYASGGKPSCDWDDRLPVKPWSTNWPKMLTRAGSP